MNKEWWKHKPSQTLLCLCGKNLFKLRSGPLDIFGSRFSLMGIFLDLKTWPHSPLSVSNAPGYPYGHHSLNGYFI